MDQHGLQAKPSQASKTERRVGRIVEQIYRHRSAFLWLITAAVGELLSNPSSWTVPAFLNTYMWILGHCRGRTLKKITSPTAFASLLRKKKKKSYLT